MVITEPFWSPSSLWFSSHFISWFFILLSGARMLYKNLPRAVGLRRITLHKSLNLKNEVVYFLLVECSNFMDHIGEAANLLPVLRARICGYTGIFRCVDSFWQEPPLPMTKSSKLTFEETATEEVRLLAEGDTQNRTEDLDKSEPSPSSTKKPGFFSSLLFGSSWQIQSYEKYSRTCASKWGPPNLVFVATFKEFSSKKTNVFLLKVG